MTKRGFTKTQIYTYTLALTNLDLGFRVNGWGFEG